jgi:predicted transcriptional regulator
MGRGLHKNLFVQTSTMAEVGQPLRVVQGVDWSRIVENQRESKNLATKIYLLSLCRSKDKVPKTEILCKENIEGEPANDFRKKVGLAAERKVNEIVADFVEKEYIDETEPKMPRHYKITEKGMLLQKFYVQALFIQSEELFDIYCRYRDRPQRLAEIESIAKNTSNFSEERKEKLEEELSEGDTSIKQFFASYEKFLQSEHKMEAKESRLFTRDQVRYLQDTVLFFRTANLIGEEEVEDIRKILNSFLEEGSFKLKDSRKMELEFDLEEAAEMVAMDKVDFFSQIIEAASEQLDGEDRKELEETWEDYF